MGYVADEERRGNGYATTRVKKRDTSAQRQDSHGIDMGSRRKHEWRDGEEYEIVVVDVLRSGGVIVYGGNGESGYP